MKQVTSTLKTSRTSASNIGFAEKLVSQGNWFHRETCFFLPLLKIYHYTCGETNYL